MRQARLRMPEDYPLSHYHCLSRVVDRRFAFDAAEKDQFIALLRECENFCEVRVLTYCLLCDHFHVLVEVPRQPEALPTPEEIHAKLRTLSGHQDPGQFLERLTFYRQRKDTAGEARYLESYYRRLWDLSAFMKLLKQRFTQWYNARQGRRGTLWEERFKSVLVEGTGQAMVAMAAYIDLNPVRAGLVDDPGEYRWSGYGEAVAGRRNAKAGLQRIVQALQGGEEASLSRSLEVYRMHFSRSGGERQEALGDDGRPLTGSLPREAAVQVLDARKQLPLHEYLRCRVRYFCDGAVFGSRKFVEEIFQANRARFGPKRKSGARGMRGLKDGELYTLRDLQLKVFG
jgi:REP element-mobilizing transposase RayT